MTAIRLLSKLVALLVVVIGCKRSSSSESPLRLEAPDASVALRSGELVVRTTSKLALIDRAGQLQWERAVKGTATGSLAADNQMVVVRYYTRSTAQRPGEQRAAAFGLDGALRWDTLLAELAEHDPRTGSYEALLAGGVVVASVYAGAAPKLVAVDRTSGAIAWSVPGPTGAVTARQVGAHLVEDESGTNARWRDLGTGSTRPIEGRGCFDGRSWIAERDSQLVQHTSLEQQRAVPTLPQLRGMPPRVRLLDCGTYGDGVVLFVQHYGTRNLDHAFMLLVLDAGLQLQRAIEVAHDDVAVRSVLAGPLPRFVPLQIDRRTVMVDLEDGRVMWRQPATSDNHGFQFARRGAHWYAFAHHQLVLLDGTRGELVRALRFGGVLDTWLIGLDERSLTNDGVWVVARRERPLAALDLLLLDDRSLETRFQRGDVLVTDDTDAVRGSFGMR